VWPGLLIVKLTPNITDIAPIARAAESAGADALSLVNTFKGLALERATLRPLLGAVTGGLSGPAVKPLALRFVFEVYEAVSLPWSAWRRDRGAGCPGLPRVRRIRGGGRLRSLPRSLALLRLKEDLERELRVRGGDVKSLVGCAHNVGDMCSTRRLCIE